MRAPRNRRRTAAALGAAAVLLVSLAGPSLSASEDRILVPGGTTAVVRLLGNVRTEPDLFIGSLNRVLLQTVQSDHAGEDVPARVDLFALMETVSELQATFEFPLILEGGSPEAAGEFDVFSRALGFVLRSRESPLQLDAREGDFAERRRRIARALDWNLSQIAHRLDAGESVRIEIRTDEVEPILPLREWQQLTGLYIQPENALGEMVIDQPLGLLSEGLRRLTAETRAALADELQWIYRDASKVFFRYSAALEVRDGDLVLPGGSGTAEAWSALVGVPTTDLRGFLRALLTAEDAGYAHIWGGLYHLPEPVARYWVEQYVAAPQSSARLARFLDRLEDAHGNYFFGRARGRAEGFPFLARTTPFEGNDAHPVFHGEPAVWLQSARDAGDGLTRDSLARSVSRANREELPPDDVLAAIMTGATSMDGFPVLLSHRYAGIARVFESSPELLTPEVVLALGRAYARFPATLDALDRTRLRRAKTVRDYFLAVGRLDKLEHGAGRELLLSHFQGGVGLVAALYAAEHVDDGILEEALADWVRLHLEGRDAEQVLSAQPAWLRSLLERLPSPDPFSPGRGPLERAWLLALSPAEDPQYLRRGGLLYRGTRARDLAEGMLDRLERERVPPVDWFLRQHAALGDLVLACASADKDRSRTLAAETLGLLQEPDARRPPPREEPTDPAAARLGSLLAALADETAAVQLPGYVPRLERARLGVARRLRPILVAPAYFGALSRIDNVLVSEPPLIRRHTVLQHRIVDSIGTPDPMAPWKPARVVRASDTDFGAHASGHLDGVDAALLGLHAQTHHPGASELLGLLTRQQRWYVDAVRSPWPRITPEVSRYVEAILAAGDELIAAAVAGLRAGRGVRFNLVTSRIPLYRLERLAGSGESVVIGPSERFAIGLAAARGDAHDSPALDLLSEDARAALSEAAGAITDLPRRLAAVGVPTRHIDGRRAPWVGTWPPYEALDREEIVDAMAERELLDLRIRIIEYLARNEIAGETGADLQIYVLQRMSRELRLEDEHDWETVIAWINGIDDDYLDQGIRWCMQRGFYRVQDF